MGLALYRAHWAQGRDISDIGTILQAVEETGLCRTRAVKIALRDELSSDVEAGVFGSPSVVADGEQFWGADRLPMIEAWLGTDWSRARPPTLFTVIFPHSPLSWPF